MSEEVRKYRQGNKKMGEGSLYSLADDRKQIMDKFEKIKSRYEETRNKMKKHESSTRKLSKVDLDMDMPSHKFKS